MLFRSRCAVSKISLWIVAAGVVVFGITAALLHRNGAQATAADRTAVALGADAQVHAAEAQAIPDHTAELADAQRTVAQLKARLARLRQQPEKPSDSTPETAPAPIVPDQVISAQDAVIQAQTIEIGKISAALADEQKRSAQWHAAYDDERKARAAQEAATEAWKRAVKESRWMGRGEGFAAGVALALLRGAR